MRRYLAVATAVLVFGTLVPAAAQESIEEARARKEALQEDAARTAAEIDVLEAEDAEIVAALNQIDEWIAVQESHLARAQQDLAATLESEAHARGEAAALDSQIGDLETVVRERSVDTYIQGFTGADGVLLNAGDINSVPLLRFVLDESTGLSAATTDILRVAVERQQEAIEQAEAAAADAIALQADIQARIADLESTQTQQQVIREEVTRRIDALEREAQVLADENEQVEQFIQDEIARLAAEEERRRQEEARRAAEAEAQRRAEEEARAAEQAAADQAAADQAAADQAAAEEAAQAEETADDGAEPTPPATPEPEPPPDTSGAPRFQRPVPGAVSSGFGNRIHPVYGTRRMHTGIDFNAASGSPIAAAAAGTVIFASRFSGYGNTVIVQHSGGYTSLYAHMSGFAVTTGDRVAAGETIGFVGSTGLSTGPHLHFEIRVDGTAVDPAPFL